MRLKALRGFLLSADAGHGPGIRLRFPGGPITEARLALRRFFRRPFPSGIAALTLAIGISASTAAFTAVDRLLLRNLPVAAQDELVVAWHANPARGFSHVPFTPSAFEIVEGSVPGFHSVAAFESAGARRTVVDGPSGDAVLHYVRVAGDFFGVLGVVPRLGRLLDGDDDRVGAAPSLVLSHGAWVSEFGEDPEIVGSTLRFGEQSFTVVGIAPEDFDIPAGTDVWVTLRGAFPDWAQDQPVGIELDILARLASGTNFDHARENLSRVLRADPTVAPDYGNLVPTVSSLEDWARGGYRPVLRVLLSASLVLLLAAVANVALLLLAGGASIAQEMAIHRALGASPSKLLTRWILDAAVVGILGAAAGLGLAAFALKGLVPLAPLEMKIPSAFGIDLRAAGFASLLTFAAVLLSAFVAGFAFSRANLRTALSAGGRGTVGAGERARWTVAGIQIAMAVLTAVGAGLMVRTVSELRQLDLGFDPSNLTVVSLSHPYGFFRTPDSYRLALHQVSRRLEGTPGIAAATPTVIRPLATSGLDVVFLTEGQDPTELPENPYLATDAVLPGYFRAVGMVVRRGRALQPGDDAGGAPVVVINESTAEALFPGLDPIGRRLNMSMPGYEEVWWTVVGVVEDTRYRDFVDPRPSIFFPLNQMTVAPPSYLLVRTTPDGPESLRSMVNEAFAREDGSVTVLAEDRMETLLAGPTARPRFAAGILLAFSLCTFLLAALGVYGVFTLWALERRAEVGVRRALGASRESLVGLVLGRVLRVAVPGATAGLLAAIFLTPALESLLFGVTARDPAVLVGAAAGSVAIAMVGSLLPAIRASGTKPAVVLQSE